MSGIISMPDGRPVADNMVGAAALAPQQVQALMQKAQQGDMQAMLMLEKVAKARKMAATKQPGPPGQPPPPTVLQQTAQAAAAPPPPQQMSGLGDVAMGAPQRMAEGGMVQREFAKGGRTDSEDTYNNEEYETQINPGDSQALVWLKKAWRQKKAKPRSEEAAAFSREQAARMAALQDESAMLPNAFRKTPEELAQARYATEEYPRSIDYGNEGRGQGREEYGPPTPPTGSTAAPAGLSSAARAAPPPRAFRPAPARAEPREEYGPPEPREEYGLPEPREEYGPPEPREEYAPAGTRRDPSGNARADRDSAYKKQLQGFADENSGLRDAIMRQRALEYEQTVQSNLPKKGFAAFQDTMRRWSETRGDNSAGAPGWYSAMSTANRSGIQAAAAAQKQQEAVDRAQVDFQRANLADLGGRNKDNAQLAAALYNMDNTTEAKLAQLDKINDAIARGANSARLMQERIDLQRQIAEDRARTNQDRTDIARTKANRTGGGGGGGRGAGGGKPLTDAQIETAAHRYGQQQQSRADKTGDDSFDVESVIRAKRAELRGIREGKIPTTSAPKTTGGVKFLGFE